MKEVWGRNCTFPAGYSRALLPLSGVLYERPGKAHPGLPSDLGAVHFSCN